MKKFFTMLVAMVMMFTLTTNAQTIEESTFFENTYISINGGATTTGMFKDVPSPFFWDGAKSIVDGARLTTSVELGKYITPAVGFSVEGIGYFNTTTSKTAFDEMLVVGNAKLNVFNWLGGYKGYPRRVELVGVVGMGYGHDFVGEGQTWTSSPDVASLEKVYGVGGTFTDQNYVAYRTGAELNINLGQARAWQISIRPGVTWFNKRNEEYQSMPRFANDARANLTVGLVYKFGSKRKGGSHNFVVCPYNFTQADIDAAIAEALKKRPAEVKVDTVIKKIEVVKEVPVEKTETVYNPLNVTFAMGSANLTAVEKAKIADYLESTGAKEVFIVGSADKGTGTVERNEYLAKERANAVAKEIENKGIKVRTDFTFDVIENSPEASRAAIINVE